MELIKAQPAKVSAHGVPKENAPNQITFLIEFEQTVIEREHSFRQ